jgi:tripartite-type tricarboxylate transporter receptor subunit TctC
MPCGVGRRGLLSRKETVRILVGSPPGGGYHLYARLIAPYLAARLEAAVLVENKDGAHGLAALSAMLVRPGRRAHLMHEKPE